MPDDEPYLGVSPIAHAARMAANGCPPDHVKVWDPALQLWKCAHVNDVALAEAVWDLIDQAAQDFDRMLTCPLCGIAEVVHDDAACKAKMAAWRPTGLLGGIGT